MARLLLRLVPPVLMIGAVTALWSYVIHLFLLVASHALLIR